MVLTERRHRVVQVVEAIEEGDVGSPDPLGARHRLARPVRNLIEDEPVALPGYEIARATAGNEACGIGFHAGGEDVIRLALPDDAGIVHGGEVALHARVDRAWIPSG